MQFTEITVKILSLGAIGIGFFLGFFSYLLLKKEQSKPKKEQSDRILKSIREYMILSVILVFLGGVFVFLDKYISFQPKTEVKQDIAVSQTPCPTPIPTPNINVEISPSLQGDVRNIEIEAGAARLPVSGSSNGVFKTESKIYACFQFRETAWWCRNVKLNLDGKWNINLHPGNKDNPIKDGDEVKLKAVIDIDGAILKMQQKPDDEFPIEDLNRFENQSKEIITKVYLK